MTVEYDSLRYGRSFIEALREGDNDAWKYVLNKIVIPAANIGSLKRRMDENSITVEDLFDTLWEKLAVERTKAGAIPLYDTIFHDDEDVRRWLFSRVRYVLLEMIRYKNTKKRTFDKFNPAAPPVNTLPDHSLDLADDNPDAIAARACFRELWNINPRAAYVILFLHSLQLFA